MNRRRLKLRARFVLVVAAGVLAVGAAMGVVSFYEARRVLLETRREELVELARLQATKVALRMAQVADRPLVAASALQSVPDATAADINRLVRSVLGDSPQVYGMAVAFEPYAFEKDKRFYCPYFYHQGDKIV